MGRNRSPPPRERQAAPTSPRGPQTSRHCINLSFRLRSTGVRPRGYQLPAAFWSSSLRMQPRLPTALSDSNSRQYLPCPAVLRPFPSPFHDARHCGRIRVLHLDLIRTAARAVVRDAKDQRRLIDFRTAWARSGSSCRTSARFAAEQLLMAAWKSELENWHTDLRGGEVERGFC